MTDPLAITAIELVFKLLEIALRKGEITKEEVARRINQLNKAADASEDRIDNLLGD